MRLIYRTFGLADFLIDGCQPTSTDFPYAAGKRVLAPSHLSVELELVEKIVQKLIPTVS